jgi:hypothetical protein
MGTGAEALRHSLPAVTAPSFSFLVVPSQITNDRYYDKIQKANLCIQHAINALRGLGNNADADLVHELWRRCGRDDQTLSLFRQVYALS